MDSLLYPPEGVNFHSILLILYVSYVILCLSYMYLMLILCASACHCKCPQIPVKLCIIAMAADRKYSCQVKSVYT